MIRAGCNCWNCWTARQEVWEEFLAWVEGV